MMPAASAAGCSLLLGTDWDPVRTKLGEGAVVQAVFWFHGVIQRQADAVAKDEEHDDELKV